MCKQGFRESTHDNILCTSDSSVAPGVSRGSNLHDEGGVLVSSHVPLRGEGVALAARQLDTCALIHGWATTKVDGTVPS